MQKLIEKLYVGIDQKIECRRDDDRIEIMRLDFDGEELLNFTATTYLKTGESPGTDATRH
jgi:hypothetical protein